MSGKRNSDGLLLPKQDRTPRQVFLSKELWDELTDVAAFHDDAFTLAGIESKVSRNDMLQAFLLEDVARYWADKGGKPTTEKERVERVKQLAEAVKKEMKERKEREEREREEKERERKRQLEKQKP